ncbi:MULTISPECIES: hypothetical protein [Pseudomonas syringae group]|uniref:Lipoprotein n=4 Tax=Pseudomonas syringae group TaxID=136849 RepID=A0AAD0GRJ4_9PSED|nr:MULTISPECIES: hypothetical protein [Pseudomonas syringae group]AVB20916.1 hypothetical protein BKM03_18085 [Pseudomonas avellanae]EGH09782.1 putative lipoprotein [Pseudomonas amygdali pv. morsprunorum str. M302280]KWS71133.1 hypothetical protein AL055_13880 [Pseudomonas amygdali pv. morsprunorum]PHN49329.1 hypothetical protein AO261_27110 [Pseudomonas avellanae]POC93549.1 hypothetical protein BKM26_12030 [Pseudomonas avellanae]
MSVLNTLTACMLTAALTGFSLDSLGQSASVKPEEVVRSIEFRQKNEEGGDTCTVGIKESDITVNLNDEDYGCVNDQMRYFRLNDVRSATRIYLESKDCDDEGGWVFVLKTYVDPVTTGLIAIDDLKSSAAGSVVVAGVLMESKKNDDENTTGKLSCVRIDVSG